MVQNNQEYYIILCVYIFFFFFQKLVEFNHVMKNKNIFEDQFTQKITVLFITVMR